MLTVNCSLAKNVCYGCDVLSFSVLGLILFQCHHTIGAVNWIHFKLCVELQLVLLLGMGWEFDLSIFSIFKKDRQD